MRAFSSFSSLSAFSLQQAGEGPETAPELTALTITSNTIAENTAAGALVGTVLGATPGSSLSLVDNSGNRFALSGGNVVAGAVGTNFEAATSHQITIRETLAGASNTPRDTTFIINVTNVNEQPNLTALTLSSSSATQGSNSTINIVGATAGSTIAGAAPDGMALNSATRTISGTPTTAGTYNFTLTETLADSANSPRVSNVTITVATTPETIGGIQVGTAGAAGTLYENFKLIAGDDFDTTPSRWSGRNLTGKYAHSALSVGFRQTSAADNAMYVDPAFRGARSQSPTDLGYDRVATSSSILALTASAPETEILPFLPTTYTGGRGDANNRPRLLTGSLKTAPHFMLSAQANFIVECRVRLAAGVARGYWHSFWTSTFFWPDRGEVDIVEVKKDSSGNMISLMNIYGNASDGAPAEFTTVAQPAYPANQWINVMARRVGNTMFFYDDAANPGTYALRGSSPNFMARFSGAHDIRLDMAVSTNWDASTFSAGDWPKGVEFDWWRVWVPTAAGPNRATQILPAVNTTPGGSWAATFPSAVELHGSGAGLEQVTGAFDNYDAPGYPTRNTTTRLPTSMTVNLSTRTVSGTVPTTEGGCLPIFITYAYNDGTPASRVMLPFNVAPAVQSLFGNQTVIEGAAINLSVGYTAFHSGNLGPHTYTATSDQAWATVSGNGTQSLTITGTAPASGVATLTINCTNSIGQTTTVTRTITAQPAPSLWFEDTFAGAGGTLAGRVASTGGTWSTHPQSTATHSLSGTGGIYQPTTNIGWMTNSQAAPNANYYVEADLLVKSVIATASISVNGRMDASALTFYGIRYTGTSFILYRSVNGTLTTLATYTFTQPTGVQATIRLEMNGDQISGYVDGVLRMGPITDDIIKPAGRVGTRIFGNNAAPTTGQHFEAMRAGSL